MYSFENLLFPALYIPLFPTFAGIQKRSKQNLAEQRKYRYLGLMTRVATILYPQNCGFFLTFFQYIQVCLLFSSWSSFSVRAKRSLEFPESPSQNEAFLTDTPPKRATKAGNIKDNPAKKAKPKQD
ncbi:uncharacterized protein LOC113772346 [Coffea eugenioides]|uniref:uncharacterized protein LOC113772346 n=1 Tax=Coffea eugenioides TaxID=49369 RepID=UPI000F60D223|nr:uncharacterized protein LOC113772346 [Coffea eugenioides]